MEARGSAAHRSISTGQVGKEEAPVVTGDTLLRGFFGSFGGTDDGEVEIPIKARVAPLCDARESFQ